MGLHLTLHVLGEADNLSSISVPLTSLDIIEDMRLNRQLVNVEAFGKSQNGVIPVATPRPVLRGFMLEVTLPDNHSHKYDTDFYGNPLTWLYADELGAVVLERAATEEGTYAALATAALAYIAQLPPDTPVVLYWG